MEEEIKIDDIMDVVEFKKQPVSETREADKSGYEEPIRIYDPPAKIRSLGDRLLGFLILTAAFFLVFCIIAYLMEGRGQDGDGDDSGEYQQAVMLPENSDNEEQADDGINHIVNIPLVIDESKAGIAPDVMNTDYSLHHLVEASDGVKLLIVHSHNSESVSSLISVADAGSAIAQILTSAGIDTLHSTVLHDSEGSIGAYSKMKTTVSSVLEKHPGVFCVIDLHDSDSGLPLTFTVATEGEGWSENLRLAEAVCGRITDTQSAFRFLPGTLGQDNGILTLNVGICGESYEDQEARAVISSLADAIIEICNEKTSAQ